MPNYGIHNYANREIGLTTPQVQMTTFTPLEFKWQGVDPEFLSKHLQYADALDAENMKQESIIKQAMDKRRENIHNDPKTLQLFDAKRREYEDKVKKAVDANMGSYHRLGKLMSDLASDAVNDKTFVALESAETQRKEWVKNNIDSNANLSPASKRFWRWKVEKNFDNGLIFDKNDPTKVIGNKEWDSHVNVYDDLNPTQIAAVIGKITAFKRRASTDTTGAYGVWDKDAKGKITPGSNAKENQDNITFSVTSGFEREWLSKDQLEKTFDDLYKIDPTLPHQFEAEYEKEIFAYNENKDILNDPSKSDEVKQIARDNIAKFEVNFGTPGNMKDYKQFFATKLKEYIDNQSYNRTSSVSKVDVDPISGSGKSNPAILSSFGYRPGKGKNIAVTNSVGQVIIEDSAEKLCDILNLDRSYAAVIENAAKTGKITVGEN